MCTFSQLATLYYKGTLINVYFTMSNFLFQLLKKHVHFCNYIKLKRFVCHISKCPLSSSHSVLIKFMLFCLNYNKNLVLFSNALYLITLHCIREKLKHGENGSFITFLCLCFQVLSSSLCRHSD